MEQARTGFVSKYCSQHGAKIGILLLEKYFFSHHFFFCELHFFRQKTRVERLFFKIDFMNNLQAFQDHRTQGEGGGGGWGYLRLLCDNIPLWPSHNRCGGGGGGGGDRIIKMPILEIPTKEVKKVPLRSHTIGSLLFKAFPSRVFFEMLATNYRLVLKRIRVCVCSSRFQENYQKML